MAVIMVATKFSSSADCETKQAVGPVNDVICASRNTETGRSFSRHLRANPARYGEAASGCSSLTSSQPVTYFPTCIYVYVHMYIWCSGSPSSPSTFIVVVLVRCALRFCTREACFEPFSTSRF